MTTLIPRGSILRVAFGVVLGAAVASCAPADPPSGTVVWQTPVGGQVWSPLVQDQGRLFFGTDDSTFVAFDLSSREVAWRFGTGGIIRSGAAVHDGLVTFASDDGSVYALTQATGELAWQFDLENAGPTRRLPAPDAPYDYDYRHSSPVAHGGVIYIGSGGGTVHALDQLTGQERWRFATEGRVRATPVTDGELVYVGSWDGWLYALHADDGSLAWRFDTGGIIQGTAALGEGIVVVGSRSAQLFALDAATGEPRWTYVHEDGSWVESPAVIRDGTVYVGSSDALKLFALDAMTGGTRWTAETGGWAWATPVVTGEAVYIGAISAFPYYFEGVELRGGFHAVDRESGQSLWRAGTGLVDGYITGGVFSSPAVVDGRVYIAGLDGVLYAIVE